MFTGIVEDISHLTKRTADAGNVHFTFEHPVAQELRIDQSLCHDGICLTVVDIDLNKNTYTVTAIQETLDRTNCKFWEPGYQANIERCMLANSRFDGHIVQGHVDTLGTVDEIHDVDGSFLVFISYEPHAGITVSKGSITVNGVSLTVVDSLTNAFSVAIIPHTWNKTNLGKIKEGDRVNLEFDIIGKYIQRINQPDHLL
jgi:riboflavin synthase